LIQSIDEFDSELWDFQSHTVGKLEVSPSLSSSGELYVVDADHHVWCLNVSGVSRTTSSVGTPEVLWHTRLGSNPAASAPALAADGSFVVFVNTAGDVWSYAGGAEEVQLWNSTLDSTAQSIDVGSSIALSMDDSVAYVGTAKGVLMAIDTADGHVLWSLVDVFGFTSLSTPSVDASGVVYVGTDEGALCAVDGAEGKVLWCSYFRGSIEVPVSVSGDFLSGGHVMFPLTGSFAFMCLNATTGEEVWSIGTNAASPSAGAVTQDGFVFFGDESLLVGVNITSGDFILQFQVGLQILAPTISGSGGIIVIGSGGSQEAYQIFAPDPASNQGPTKPGGWKFRFDAGRFEVASCPFPLRSFPLLSSHCT
jgi:outer membrane protein assembly factor BamB